MIYVCFSASPYSHSKSGTSQGWEDMWLGWHKYPEVDSHSTLSFFAYVSNFKQPNWTDRHTWKVASSAPEMTRYHTEDPCLCAWISSNQSISIKHVLSPKIVENACSLIWWRRLISMFVLRAEDINTTLVVLSLAFSNKSNRSLTTWNRYENGHMLCFCARLKSSKRTAIRCHLPCVGLYQSTYISELEIHSSKKGHQSCLRYHVYCAQARS